MAAARQIRPQHKVNMASSKLVVFAALLSGAAAECVNSCSGHGHCTNYQAQFSTAPLAVIQVPTASKINGGTSDMNSLGYDTRVPMKDSCTCFSHVGFNGNTVYQWTGPDCSLKTCPYGESWNGASLSSNAAGTTRGTAFHTQHLECSNMGLCNRKTGICECFDGYTGEACQRSQCPNDCSNAGVCMDLEQIVENVKEDSNYYGNYMASLTYTAWDKTQLRGCICDKGRSGPDCSMIDCPSESDPLGGLGSESGRACSSRGTCDFDTGQCNCFQGYFGTSCNQQRNAQI